MSNFITDLGSAGFASSFLQDVFVMRQVIDLAKVKDSSGVITNLTAADTINPALKIPAGSAVLSAGLTIITAMVGGTAPTISMGDSTGAAVYISALSLAATAVKEADGTLWETTGNVIKSAVTYNADDYLRLSFGGTFPASSNGVVEAWAIVARVKHA